jgi:hypothetical protein
MNVGVYIYDIYSFSRYEDTVKVSVCTNQLEMQHCEAFTQTMHFNCAIKFLKVPYVRDLVRTRS